MILEDFIMLGRTVPEDSKKHGRVVCSAGYSKELRQFLRIYPLTMFERIPRWSVCCVALRRNQHDSRQESWRLREKDPLQICGKAKKDDEFEFLRSLASGSIRELNEKRASLGIITPDRIDWRFDGMKKNEEYLLPLFPEEKPDYHKPRIQFSDHDGIHDLQLRDWGSHEFLRKNPASKHCNLWDALRLTHKEYEHLLFVGNHNQHRTSWLVIGIVSSRTRLQGELFESVA